MSDKPKEKTGAEEIAWDLSGLYQGVDDPAIDKKLGDAATRATQLAEEYKGRVADLDAEELRDLVEEYEAISEVVGKTGMYAYLEWSVNAADPATGALRQKILEQSTAMHQTLLFLELEWADVPEEQAKKMMADPVVAKYQHWLEVARRNRPYLLSEPEERILSEKAVTGKSAWKRYLDQVLSAARYDYEGESLNQSELLGRTMFHPDREVRQAGAAAFTAGLEKIRATTTYVFNVILADKASEDKMRGYPSWITERNMANEVEDEAVETLVDSVTSRYDIVSRYYKLKRRLLGLDELTDYDRYAPMPTADKRYTWAEGQEIAIKAYDAFHPKLGEIVQRFFDENWIDAPTRPGKIGGAYCYSIGGDEGHPYVFLNYEAKPTDVMTLAHELGHGVHGVLAGPRGALLANTPLTTAETASVFGEMLVFQDLYGKETDPAARLALLTEKLENEFSTVFRQIAMNRFEDAIHHARRTEGELPTERFNEMWLQTQRDMFQDSLTIRDDYGLWWSYVTHFTDRPGYVYAYSFGNLLVLALYARYQEVGEGFAEGYMEMLGKGGSDWPHEIVKPLGIDLTDPDFWKQGLQILDDMVVEAEELAEQVG